MTKTIYLIRHAKSSWKDASLADYDRPLNKRGKRDAPEMGQRLRKKAIKLDWMISSPAKRAKLTALAIAEAIGHAPEKIQWEPELYHAASETILEQIHQTGNQHQTITIFGHNPGLTDFQNELCNEAIDNIVTTGITCIQVEVDNWKKISLNGSGKLLWYDYPKRIAHRS
ncbi:MAG: histidine phosphatase family protein [Cyclobacteriaceae bacterium]